MSIKIFVDYGDSSGPSTTQPANGLGRFGAWIWNGLLRLAGSKPVPTSARFSTQRPRR